MDALDFVLNGTVVSCGKRGGGSFLGADWLAPLDLTWRSRLPHALHVPAGDSSYILGLIGWKEIALIFYSGSIQGKDFGFYDPSPDHWDIPGMGALVNGLL